MRIAMWSGPRNLSTAMMYSFGQRSDCAVWDEPFYAAYLAATGANHPMRAEVMAAGEPDPARVAEACAGPVPGGRAHWYLKHMAHHMLEGFPLGWARGFVNVHLIRHPARVIASYGAKRAEMSLEDIGFPQQLRLFRELGGHVVDADDIRTAPEAMLRRICALAGIGFDPAMLAWPAGPKPWDGAWAPHWYDAVHRSTGFAPPEAALPSLEGPAARLCAAAMPSWEELKARAEPPG